ncbi:unnamed protein product [Callosobruchus maculatus]|uniref:RNA helicase n=1 Tax=Callosobruchus maculatus TaxID=64391 RepID=A0A653BYA5_CALMS|nr:unnamed protein product [Callosobruchus maculatus]
MEERCDLCIMDDDSNPNDDPAHKLSPKHIFNFMLWEYNKYRKALVKNRHGVELIVTVQQVNGYIYDFSTDDRKGKYTLKITPETLKSHHSQIEFKCTIRNNRKSMNVLIHPGYVLLFKHEYFEWYDPQNNLNNEKYVELTPGSEYSVVVQYQDPECNVSDMKLPLSFTFQTVEPEPHRFSIVRSINISVGTRDEISNDETGPSPFKGQPWPPGIEIMRPTKFSGHQSYYPIPPRYWKALLYGIDCGGYDYQILNELRGSLQPGHVTRENFKRFWHIVLWQEEIAQTISLQHYNMENVTLRHRESENAFALEVPGLAEKRPSVIRTDFIDIKTVGDEHRGYRGVIKSVEDKEVLIENIDKEFTEYWNLNPTIEMSVRFVLSRLSYERMHQGVDQVAANGMVPLLFPNEDLRERTVYERRTLNDADFFNTAILSNPEQRIAVSKILNNTAKPVPYIVFGPPGTGKTVTLVEAILQIMKKTEKKILVCAPANAACDVVAEKLMRYCRKEEMIRLMSHTVDMNNIPPMLLDYSNYDKQSQEFKKVPADELHKYRVVITTLIYVGQYSRKFHPDVIFIDEAAQAPEPEVCSAIGIGDKNTQIVLAGDPKQLGPSVFSKPAKRHGLEFSLLERMMERDLYASGDSNYITMLKKNFRSHETILELPNKLFYGGQLEALSADARDDPLARVNVLERIANVQHRNKKKGSKPSGSALEYFSLISKEQRQGKSPSYFNPKETEMVFKCVQALLMLRFPDGDQNVKEEEIGIITPYVRQVSRIRQYLNNHNIERVEVGTTETFQGREKRIIIISTVRAQKDLLLHDQKYRLGFVKQKKRFNVALTRAKSKLIVIGCAHVLCTDKKWQQYIEFSEELGSFYGSPYHKIIRTDENIEDIMRRLGNVQTTDTQNAHQQ